jgi:hypothetical protein
MTFPDGQLPSKDQIKKWLEVVDDFFTPGSSLSKGTDEKQVGGAGEAADHVVIEKRTQPSQPL